MADAVHQGVRVGGHAVSAVAAGLHALAVAASVPAPVECLDGRHASRRGGRAVALLVAVPAAGAAIADQPASADGPLSKRAGPGSLPETMAVERAADAAAADHLVVAAERLGPEASATYGHLLADNDRLARGRDSSSSRLSNRQSDVWSDRRTETLPSHVGLRSPLAGWPHR